MLALAVPIIILPLTNVFGAISPREGALAVTFVILELTNILVAAGIGGALLRALFVEYGISKSMMSC